MEGFVYQQNTNFLQAPDPQSFPLFSEYYLLAAKSPPIVIPPPNQSSLGGYAQRQYAYGPMYSPQDDAYVYMQYDSDFTSPHSNVDGVNGNFVADNALQSVSHIEHLLLPNSPDFRPAFHTQALVAGNQLVVPVPPDSRIYCIHHCQVDILVSGPGTDHWWGTVESGKFGWGAGAHE